MFSTWKRRLTIAASVLALALSACEKQPFERGGKAIDRAVKKTGDRIRDALRE